MYPNSHLRWASPSVHFAHQEGVIKTPAYRHLALVVVLFTAVILGGTTQALKIVASKQVSYRPSTVTAVKSNIQPAPAPKASPPASQPALSPPVINHTAQVQAVLDSWNASHPKQEWSVVVQGLGANQTNASLNPNISYNTASLYKLFLMDLLFKDYSLESLSKNYVSVTGKGPVNLKTCVDLMIKNSDNPCGVAVGNKLGWAHTTTLLRQIGLSATNLNIPNGTVTTAADVALYLQKLNAGQLISSDEQQYLISLMQQQKYRSGIPAGCDGCTVADKVGDLGFVRHDAGIVKYDGGSYILVIMTNGATYAQIAALTSQIQSAITG